MFKKIYVFRINPGEELLSEITNYCANNHINSAVIIGIIGSLQKATLSYLKKLPGKYEGVDYSGPLEIVGAQGSVALKDNSPIVHIHIQLSQQHSCCGGHLTSAIIFSTAEVVIGELNYQLERQIDSYTGLNELIA